MFQSFQPRLKIMIPVAFLLIALIAFLIAVNNFNGATQCKADISTCEDELIQRVRAAPADRESVAQAALAVYGSVIKVAESRGLTNGLAPNLRTSYATLVEGLRNGTTDPECVREGLIDLLIQDNLDSSRAAVLSASFDVAAKTTGILPNPIKALDFQFTIAADLPSAGTFLVGTYSHYSIFPVSVAGECAT